MSCHHNLIYPRLRGP